MNEKDIDKIFRDGLNNRDIEYNPVNWEKMSAFLDENPITVKRAPYYYNVIIIGLSLILSLVVFYGVKILLNRDSLQRTAVAQDSTELSGGASEDYRITRTISQSVQLPEEEGFDNSLSGPAGRQIDLSLADAGKEIRDIYTGIGGDPDALSIDNIPGTLVNTENRQTGNPVALSDIVAEGAHFEQFEAESSFHAENRNSENLYSGEQVQEGRIGLPEFDMLAIQNKSLLSRGTVDLKGPRLTMRKPKMRFTLDAVAGAGFVHDLQYYSLRTALFAGIEFSRSYGIRTGLIVSTIETPEYSGYRYEANSYGFGLSTSKYDLQVRKNKSISIPVEIVYKKGRHSVYSGLELEKIIASKGDLSVTNYSQYDGLSHMNALESSIWVDDRDVLPLANFNFLLGYDYLLTGRFGVGVRMESPMTFKNNINVNQEVLSPNSFYWGRMYLNVKYKILR